MKFLNDIQPILMFHRRFLYYLKVIKSLLKILDGRKILMKPIDTGEFYCSHSKKLDILVNYTFKNEHGLHYLLN